MGNFLVPKVSKKLAQKLAFQRKRERADFFNSSFACRVLAAKMSTMPMLGRDWSGSPVETMRPEAFGMTVDRWHARIVFGREDAGEFAGSSLAEAEARLKAGSIPRIKVRVNTHIIRAVRLLMHIGDGYAREIAETERVLGGLDSANVLLSGRGQRTDDEINAAILYLEEFGKNALAKKHAAVKRIAAQARLQQTVGMLKASLLPENSGNRAFAVGAACAAFTALRNRLGQWRDSEIAWRIQYNYMKECSLRILRDKWLFARIVAFADDPSKMQEYVEKDMAKLAAIGKIRAMLLSGVQNGAILKWMESQSGFFRVAGREQVGAEEAIRNAEEKGVLPPDGKKIDFLIGNYRRLYRHIREGRREQAFAALAELELFVHANKPSFILEELEKGHEPYLKPTVYALRAAVADFKSGDHAAARNGFINAAELLQKTFE